jgi:hypothetical protein
MSPRAIDLKEASTRDLLNAIVWDYLSSDGDIEKLNRALCSSIKRQTGGVIEREVRGIRPSRATRILYIRTPSGSTVAHRVPDHVDDLCIQGGAGRHPDVYVGVIAANGGDGKRLPDSQRKPRGKCGD